MTCYRPLEGYWKAPSEGDALIEGALPPVRAITFKRTEAFTDRRIDPVLVPCGKCIGCRLDYARDWAVRCFHENQMHERSSFITLTYDPLFLPAGGVLVRKHFQKFMKRLRKAYLPSPLPKDHPGIRYFACGEYGKKGGRPHYHAILYGVDFHEDRVFWKNSNAKNGSQSPLFLSPSLQSLWPFGFSSVGAVTFESSAYVARYILKKISGDAAPFHYATLDYRKGIVFQRPPEFTVMSRKPGIGTDWYNKFGDTDCHNNDFVVINSRKMRPPAFYDRLLAGRDPERFLSLQVQRRKAAKENPQVHPSRKYTQEKHKLTQINRLPRPDF